MNSLRAAPPLSQSPVSPGIGHPGSDTATFIAGAPGNVAPPPFWPELGVYAWCALGAIALVLWGLAEARRERINLGVAGFALTVSFFYFSSIMDKLGRSASLIGLGLLFLLGGWALERTRRLLIARLEGGHP